MDEGGRYSTAPAGGNSSQMMVLHCWAAFIAGELRAGPTPVRPGSSQSYECANRACEALCGRVRATTVRSELRLMAGPHWIHVLRPSELCGIGLIPTEFVTCAPRSEASVTLPAPR